MAPRDKRRRSRAWLGLRRWAALLSLFVLAIPLMAAGAVRSTDAHERLRRWAIEAFREELGLRATLGRVHVELVPLSLVATDIALDDPVYGRLADARALRVAPSVGSLLRGRIEIAAVELDEASVHLVVRDDGVRNLPRLGEGQGTGAPTLPFRELSIRRSTLSIDGAPQISAAVDNVEASVRAEGGHVVSVRFAVGGGQIQRRGRRLHVEQLSGEARLGPSALVVKRLDVLVAPLELRIEDAFVPLPLPTELDALNEVRGRVRLAYDLGHLATLDLPVALPRLAGRVQLDATIEPREGSIAATGVLEVEGGRIEQFGLGDRVRLVIDATPSLVRVRESLVEVHGGGGTVALEASLELGAEPYLRAVARPTSLSFARLMEQFDVSDDSLVEWIFDGELHLEGSLADPSRIRLEGPIALDTRDFVVTRDGYRARPMRPVLAIPRGRFIGRWSIRPDGVRFENLVADLPHSRIFGDVLLGFHNELRVDARATADLRDVSPLDRFDMAGQGELVCRIDGVFQDPRVTGHARIDDLVFDGFRLGDVDTDVVLDRDGMGVTFPLVVASKRDSRYDARDVYLDFRHDRFAMRGRLDLRRMTLSDFYHVFGFEDDERFTPYQGVVSGWANLAYTNGYPGDSPSGTLRAEMGLEVESASLNGYAFDGGRLEGRWTWLDWSRGYRGGLLELDHVELRKGRGTLTLQGSMAREGALAMTAAADRIALRDVEGIGDRFEDVDGLAGVIARVSGTADRMVLDADVTLHEVVVAGRGLGDGRAFVRMTYDDDPWVREAAGWRGRDVPADEPCGHARRGLAFANWPEDPPLRTVDGLLRRHERPAAFLLCGSILDGRVAFDLAVGRQSSYPIRGKIQVLDVELARFLPSLQTADFAAPARTEGTVRAVARFDDGGLRDPATLRGQLRVATFALRRGELRLENERPIVVRFDRGVARVERARLVGPGIRIRVEGEASIASGLGLEILASVDLATLPRAVPAVLAAEGTLGVRLTMTGLVADPEYYGEAWLTGGMLRLAALNTPIAELGGHATFGARRVVVEELAATVAGGRVGVTGEASLEGRSVSRYAFRIVGRELSFEPYEGVFVTLGMNADLAWSRGERLPSLTGEIRVSRLEYLRNIALGTTLGELARTQRTEVERYDPGQDFLSLELRIRNDRPLVVRNNLVDAELEIEDSERPFRLVGTNQRFGAIGDMRFARGRVFFRNAAFDLRPGGSLTFDDEHSISPRFDVHAVTELRRSGDLTAPSWRVTLDATGTREAFSIRTHSDPDLPQEDILLLLAVGLTRGELETLRGGDLTSTLALEALASVTGIDREVRRALPVIDDFRVSSAYSVRTGRTEPQVSIGKRIADRVRLSATTGLSEAREFRAVLEAQLTDTTSIQAGYDNYNLTSASSFGNVGVDLRWRLEFQ